MKAIKGQVVELNQNKQCGYIVPVSGRMRVTFTFDDYSESLKRLDVGQEVLFRIVKDETGQGKAVGVQMVLHCRFSLVTAIWFSLAMIGCVWYFHYPIEILIYYIGLNLLVWLVFWLDKRASQKEKPVTGESTILFLSLAGGWVASSLAPTFYKMRPKSSLYRTFFIIVIALQLAFFGWSLHPKGERWVGERIERLYQQHPILKHLTVKHLIVK